MKKFTWVYEEITEAQAAALDAFWVAARGSERVEVMVLIAERT